jgi:hypothetical protein
MKIELTKLCEFEIPCDKDRSDLCAILSTAGYATRLEKRVDYSRLLLESTYYVVAVFDKKDGEHDAES